MRKYTHNFPIFHKLPSNCKGIDPPSEQKQIMPERKIANMYPHIPNEPSVNLPHRCPAATLIRSWLTAQCALARLLPLQRTAVRLSLSASPAPIRRPLPGNPAHKVGLFAQVNRPAACTAEVRSSPASVNPAHTVASLRRSTDPPRARPRCVHRPIPKTRPLQGAASLHRIL